VALDRIILQGQTEEETRGRHRKLRGTMNGREGKIVTAAGGSVGGREEEDTRNRGSVPALYYAQFVLQRYTV
jgi:hypothetical protein